MLKARALVVLPVAILLAMLATRAMTFQSPADHPLRQLQSLFPGHPAALIDGAMHDIGTAAAKGGAMPASAERAIVAAAREAPLAVEPFLVNGTIAQIAGDGRRAEALFLAARLRDPRAPAARYFLADRYLRTNRIAAGLNEMSVLATLSQSASQPLGPALAAYARTPGAIPQLRKFFVGAPANRDTTLDILSQDPANAAVVFALAPALPLHQSPSPTWPATLVHSLVIAGDYTAADDVWRQINGIHSRGLLYDPQFRDRTSAPPFSWQLTSGSAGVAAPSSGGGLDVIYYGREEIVLAAQLVRLGPGNFRLAMRLDAPLGASNLAWTVTCAAVSSQPLRRLPLNPATKGMVAASFAVPQASCPVQWIELRGKPGDTEQTSQVTISQLQLVAAS